MILRSCENMEKEKQTIKIINKIIIKNDVKPIFRVDCHTVV